MKLRRFELFILALTLAFAVFMGGFFTGRRHTGTSTITVSTNDTQVSLTSTSPSSENTDAQPGENSINTDVQITVQTDTDTDAENEQTPGSVTVSDGKININTATHGELTDLPGIGDTLATRIVDYRTQNGQFKRIEDIRNVSGIGEKRFEAIMDLIKIT